MTEQDPTRLADQAAVEPQLKGALRALGREGEGAERLARVAGKLGALLDAPPPTLPVATRALRLALRQLTAGKLTVALLVVGGSLWLASQREPQNSPAAPVVRPAGSSEPGDPRSTGEPPSAPTTQPQVQLEEATLERPTEAVTPLQAQPLRHVARPAKRQAKSAVIVVRTEPPPTAPAASAAPEDALSRPPQAPRAPTAPEPPRARSEAELLFEARKALAERPRVALALLEQHAQLYARGQLAPEREVLAIEALRKLGDSEAAAARARRFRVEYPDSFHLKGLE